MSILLLLFSLTRLKAVRYFGIMISCMKVIAVWAVGLIGLNHLTLIRAAKFKYSLIFVQ